MTTITRENAAAFQRPLYRPEPIRAVEEMKTYSIISPVQTHFRAASCEEAGCLAHHNGFSTSVDETTELGARQADYIRQRAGRPFTESRAAGGLTVFTFPAGTDCFTQHQVRLDRPALFVVRRGDHRGYGRPQVHSSPEAWVDDFASHQDRLARVRS